MTFHIDAVDGAQTTVTFLFDDGSKSTQTIAGLPTDEAALAQALTDYGTAYLAGLETVKATQMPKELVGKTLQEVVPVVEEAAPVEDIKPAPLEEIMP